MSTPIIPGTSAYLWPPAPGPVVQIQPFTYSDGITFVEILYALKQYITDEIVPAFNAFPGQVNEAVVKLVAEVDAHLAEQSAANDVKIQELVTYVNEQVQLIIDDSIDVQDPVVAGMFNNPSSQTRQAADSLYTKIVEDAADPGFFIGSE